MTPPPRSAMAVGGVYLAVALGAYTAAAGAPGHRVVPYLSVHLGLTVVMLAAWAWLRRVPAGTDRDRALAMLVGTGVLARWALAAVTPFTTTDVQRYLWDGAVALHGHDPYALAPMAPALAALRAGFPLPVDHLDVATCYPPLAVGLFALAAATGGALALAVWKTMVALGSTAVVLVVWRHTRGTARAPDVVLAALSPVLLLEGAVGGHLDAFAALAVVLAVTQAEDTRWDRAALAAGCGGALKLVPGLVVVPLFFRAPRKVRFTVLAALPLVLSVALARALGMTPPGTLATVAQNWSFAAPLWTVIYHHWDTSDGLIRPSLAAAGLVGWTVLGLRRGAIARNIRDAFGWGLVVSPVLYPWYGMPLAALTALSPAGWTLAMLHAVPLSYEVIDGYQSTGQWNPRAWPLVAISVATALGLVADGAVRYARRRRGL